LACAADASVSDMATPARMAAANLFMIFLPAPRTARPNWPEGRHKGFIFSSLEKILVQRRSAVNINSDGF
jgi:hypothetical protein